jgi:tRNA-dihydrouridine synthase
MTSTRLDIPPLRLRGLLVDPPVVPAPMCGISDRAWRRLAREEGASFAFTQMASCEAVVHNDRKTWDLLDIEGEPGGEGPVGIQLFGCRPEALAEAAARLEAAGAALVDLNMGCPARKVVNSTGGSALLRHPELTREIFRAMRRAVKGRSPSNSAPGWDKYGEGRLCRRAPRRRGRPGRDHAPRAHPRAGIQGRADWSVIAALRERARLPVIGNGDIATADDAERMFRGNRLRRGDDRTRADGQSLAARRIAARIRGAPEPPPPTLAGALTA